MTPRLLIGHLRHREARLFDSACTVTRPGEGEPVFDPDTGTYVNPPAVEVYTGPCLVRPVERASRVVEAGGAAVSLRTYDVTLPAGTPVEVADTVTVTVSPDAGLVGQAMRVLDVPYDEWQVNRRVVAEDRQ